MGSLEGATVDGVKGEAIEGLPHFLGSSDTLIGEGGGIQATLNAIGGVVSTKAVADQDDARRQGRRPP